MIIPYNFALSIAYIKEAIRLSALGSVTSNSPYPRETIIKSINGETKYVLPPLTDYKNTQIQFKNEFFVSKTDLINENYNEAEKEFMERDLNVEEEWVAFVLRPTNRWSAYYLKGSPSSSGNETIFIVGDEIPLEYIRFFMVVGNRIKFFNKKEVRSNQKYQIKHWFANQQIDFVTIPINDLNVLSPDFRAIAFNGDKDEDPSGKIVSSINGYAFIDISRRMTVNKVDALPCPPNWRPQS